MRIELMEGSQTTDKEEVNEISKETGYKRHTTDKTTKNKRQGKDG